MLFCTYAPLPLCSFALLLFLKKRPASHSYAVVKKCKTNPILTAEYRIQETEDRMKKMQNKANVNLGKMVQAL